MKNLFYYFFLIVIFFTVSRVLTFPIPLQTFHPYQSVFERFPYLQDMSSHSVVILWETLKPTKGILAVKTERAKATLLKENRITRNHIIRIHSLEPNTFYWYRIISEERIPVTPWIWFKTFPTRHNSHFSFAVFGDSGNGSNYQKKVAHQIFLHHPLLILQTGDLIYGKKSPGGFDRKFFGIYWKTIKNAPIFPVLGNHDLHAEKGKPLLHTFVLPDDSPGGGRYYSFNCGDVHFTALDSMAPLSPGSTQYHWLIHDLSNSKLPLKIAYFHYPLYSSGFHRSNLSLRKILDPVFKKYHVSLVFNGHDHDYERTLPIHGTTFVVTGGGGGILYPVWASRWTAYSATVHHFVWCRVKGLMINCSAIDDRGKTFDKFTVSPPQAGLIKKLNEPKKTFKKG
jgi:hypothetical protein